MAIVKSKLLKQLKKSYPNFTLKDLTSLVDIVLNEIKQALKRGDGVELRNWGSFPTSLNKIQKLNVKFSASFGRQLEYYTGMVFKIDIKSKSKNINVINGGRYDKLISDLGSKKQVSAVGAALNLRY